MKERIRHSGDAGEFHTSEGCYITALSNTDEDPDVSIARARVAPGVTTRWHRLAGTVERYVILEGRGRVALGDLALAEVAAGDVVLIPPGNLLADAGPLHPRGNPDPGFLQTQTELPPDRDERPVRCSDPGRLGAQSGRQMCENCWVRPGGAASSC